jgi:hypothetical protein
LWVSNVVLVAALLVYAGGIAWAVAQARSLNNARPIRRELATGAFFAIGLLSSIYTVAFFGAYHQWQVARMAMGLRVTALAASGGGVQSATSGEVLSEGDALLMDVRPATIAAIKAGDVIMYRLGGDAPATVQRVLGAAGDRITITDAGLTRNGSLIGSGGEPLLPDAPAYNPEVYAHLHVQPASWAPLAVPSGFYAILHYDLGHAHGLGLAGGVEGTLNHGLWLIGRSDIVGKVIAILNPPAHRRWLG